MRKLHPWLRVVRNGDRIVNATRSQGSVKMASASKGDPVAPAATYSELAARSAPVPRWSGAVRESDRVLDQPPLDTRPPADDAFVNVFIELYPEAAPDGDAGMARIRRRVERAQPVRERVAGTTVSRRNLLCATVPVPMLDELERDPDVAFIHPADPLRLDEPEVRRRPGAKRPPSKAVGSAARYGRGEGVLIGIIDVGGFDFAHPDFLDEENGGTRFVAIWDQGGDFRQPPEGFGYGSELVKADLDDAIASARLPGLPPATWLERQSQMRPHSHGTHVASIAAGGTGVCPRAKIAAVLIDVPATGDELERRRATFSDTSRITHAVEYLLGVARREGLPISINISLGTNGGAHDGSSGVSRWLDAFLAAPGRAICVAAGNSGQEKPQGEGDLGWISGRVHASGRIPARGLEADLEWIVMGDGIEDWSENELEIWYGSQDRFIVSLRPPGGGWITVRPGEYVENRRLPDGSRVSIYNELYHPANGGNYIAIYLSPQLDPAAFRGITPGTWTVRLKGDEVRNGHFDAWIERDDPMEIGRHGSRRMLRFPSFFSERTNVDSHSISSLACGTRVIAVGNLDEARQRAYPSSSQGPTRDGRCKPEIAAPGTDIVAANGFGDPREPWISMTGTSMASPYVAGVIGLMLARNPELTAAQCLGILQRTARPLVGASYDWARDVGYGRIDPEAALDEARTINARRKL